MHTGKPTEYHPNSSVNKNSYSNIILSSGSVYLTFEMRNINERQFIYWITMYCLLQPEVINSKVQCKYYRGTHTLKEK